MVDPGRRGATENRQIPHFGDRYMDRFLKYAMIQDGWGQHVRSIKATSQRHTEALTDHSRLLVTLAFSRSLVGPTATGPITSSVR